jgi:hypothetical protein
MMISSLIENPEKLIDQFEEFRLDFMTELLVDFFRFVREKLHFCEGDFMTGFLEGFKDIFQVQL